MQTKPYKKFRPILDRVLVKLDNPEKRSAGGIIIPDTVDTMGPMRNEPHVGTVIAAGLGRFDAAGKRIPMPVEVGDRVMVHAQAHRVAPVVMEGHGLCFVYDAQGDDSGRGEPGGEVFAVIDED